MKHFIGSLLIFGLSGAALADSDDPNGYFKSRDWQIKVNKTDKLQAKSEYYGEPVQTPNFLTAELVCGNKKVVKVIDGLKYCGIDSLKMVGGKLEIMFVDFNSQDPKGYCTKQRKKYFELPSC